MDETGDYRPREWPLAHGIAHYWCSGSGFSSVNLCAVIDAEDEDHVREAVSAQGWSPAAWRFVKPKDADWVPPSDRFPPRRS